jgi:hypothetical protein
VAVREEGGRGAGGEGGGRLKPSGPGAGSRKRFGGQHSVGQLLRPADAHLPCQCPTINTHL